LLLLNGERCWLFTGNCILRVVEFDCIDCELSVTVVPGTLLRDCYVIVVRIVDSGQTVDCVTTARICCVAIVIEYLLLWWYTFILLLLFVITLLLLVV